MAEELEGKDQRWKRASGWRSTTEEGTVQLGVRLTLSASIANVTPQQVVGVGDLAWSRGDALLATHALGSCVAVCCWSPAKGYGFLLHFMLPSSALDPRRATTRPHLFCDTGLEAALSGTSRVGVDPRGLSAKLVGGASVAAGAFDVGKRNVLAARKFLWKHSIPVRGEEVLGTVSRTIHFRPSTGGVEIHSPGLKDRML